MLFQEKVWDVCKKIPEGRVSTYKEIARALNTKAYRAVGTALNKNPYGAWKRAGRSSYPSQGPILPCHRVVNSDGRIGGYAYGTGKKIEILKKEGILVNDGKVEDFEKNLFVFWSRASNASNAALRNCR